MPEFLLDEADLLDARRLDEWTGLFADDAVYWLPMDPDQVAPGDGLNIIYDDRPRLLDRVSRLTAGWRSPTSRTAPPATRCRRCACCDGQRAQQRRAGGRCRPESTR